MNRTSKFVLGLMILIIAGCEPAPSDYLQINGFTMGTSYQVTFEKIELPKETLKQQIDLRLAKINQLMSTYQDDSELSQFNRSTTTDCQTLSSETLYVIDNALKIFQLSQGKFDVTLAPLIEIWGFDKKNTANQIPSQRRIDALLEQIGSNKITRQQDCAAKASAVLSINLSAIAKGYAVDEIAKLLVQHQVKNYLVEIGGEIANKGVNPKGLDWRLAIESAATGKRSIQRVITPKGQGVATSGDYRNYFEKDGKRYSHTIDPTTGYPITHSLASITVLHPETMLADALATAMMVMGPKDAMSFANQNNIAIFMLVKQAEGFKEVYNQAFAPYLIQP